MLINFKKLSVEAAAPKKAYKTDAGFDITAIRAVSFERGGHWFVRYHTGLAIEIPAGYVGLLFPRSSVYKTDLSLANSVGVIDSGYTGEVCFVFRQHNGAMYKAGERVGQLVILPLPDVHMVEVGSLGDSDRGDGGFGSTGQ